MASIRTLRNLLISPSRFWFFVLMRFSFKWMNDESYLKLLYWLRFHNKLNLKNPESYNQKLQWLKIHDRNPEYSIDVDKYAVRKKIEDAISNELLIPLIGVFDSFDDIDFSLLPDAFVIKCTHGTHCSIVCRDKNKFDVKTAKKQVNKWLKHNYYFDAREWPYKSIVPRIIIEKYMSDDNGELIDYKFMCFDGVVKVILVHQDINNERGNHTLDLYTPDWKLLNIEWGIPCSHKAIEKPNKLSECIKIAECLSAGRKHVRVDLYIIKNHIYFGELTYYTAAGLKPFNNFEDDLLLGNWIDLRDEL